MRRRELIAGLAAILVTAAPGVAQQPTKLPRVGVLTPADSDRIAIFEAFRQGLREHGYVEGRDIVLEFRLARGDYAALPRLAAELVTLRVDVIVTDGGIAGAKAAAAATKTIPIVMGTSGDPVAQGIVPNLARPGGNVTGFTLLPTELNVKRLELLRTAFADAAAVGVLLNPGNSASELGFRVAAAAAPPLGLTIVRIEAADPEALQAIRPETLPGPLLVLPDAMFWNRRREILALAAAARAPALYPEREYAEDGGLMAYGPSVPDNFRRAAGYVDRILKGADPGELPIQQPAKFEFVVNLWTGRALGLDIPVSVLARADEVIE